MTPFVRAIVERQLEVERYRLAQSENARMTHIRQLAELEQNIADDWKRVIELEEALEEAPK